MSSDLYNPPPYVELGSKVKQYRREANTLGSVMKMSVKRRHAYADAIEAAIREKHRKLHMKTTPKYDREYQYRPPSIDRLFKYNLPIRMVGDPPHNGTWLGRERMVYEHMMILSKSLK